MPLRVGVLFGGQSAEHAVSMMSAYAVMEAIGGSYEIVPIAIDHNGHWIAGEAALKLMTSEMGRAPSLPAQDSLRLSSLPHPESEHLPMAFRPESLTGLVDVVIPILHGPMGEDGTVQGLLELAGLPYVGSGVLGSALGMDKIAMKIMLGAAGIPQVGYQGITRYSWGHEARQTLDTLEQNLPYPMFVKPANLGSSVGISKAANRAALEIAIDQAQRFDHRVIVEECVDAREFEVGILGWEEAQASVVGELRVRGHEFYDYQAKYQDGTTEFIIPANIPVHVAQQMRELAVKSFHALDCAGLARVDFFWDRLSERVFLNEINTLPGFTAYSMYPLLWEATGVPYVTLLDRLIQIAMERYRQHPRHQ